MMARLLRNALLLFLLAWQGAALAQAAAGDTLRPLRFGILPLGGALESREPWTPLLANLGPALGRPVAALSVTSYELLERAIRRNEVDIAFLSAQMALDAVTQRRMNVVAQVARQAGPSAHRAVLLTRREGPVTTLEGVLAQPERWRLARGDNRSVTGFILPQVQLFLPSRIAMETRFRSEFVGTHQATALAVANGDADVATNNTTDFERFKVQFPVEAARLHVVWTSEPTPQGQILVRRDHSPELQAKVRAAFVAYGRTPGPNQAAQSAVLKTLHAELGFVAADNSALEGAATLGYQLEKQRAVAAQWVNDEARQARLQRIEAAYAQQVAVLRERPR